MNRAQVQLRVYLGAALYKRGKFVVMENVSFESHQKAIVLPMISNVGGAANYAQVMLNSKASDAAIVALSGGGGAALVPPANGSDEVDLRTTIAAAKPAGGGGGLAAGTFANENTAKASMKSGEAGFYSLAAVPAIDAANYPAGIKEKDDKYFHDNAEDVIDMCLKANGAAIPVDDRELGAMYTDAQTVYSQNTGRLGSLDHPDSLGRMEGLQFYSNVSPKV